MTRKWYWEIWNINTGCQCAKYDFPLRTRQDIEARCASDVVRDIAKTLSWVAVSDVGNVRVFQCEACQRYWACESPLGQDSYHHQFIALGTSVGDCLYIIETNDPKAWINSAQAGAIYRLYLRELQLDDDRDFCDYLGQESETETCSEPNCTRGRILYSLMCKKHHFEHIRKRPYPFD